MTDEYNIPCKRLLVERNTMDNLNEMKCCKVEDLKEDREAIHGDLKMIRDWLKKQPHLNVRDDDESLLIFLRSSKYSIQRTKEKIENYYSMYSLLPDLFNDRDPFSPEIQALLSVGTMVPLPNPIGHCGPRIVLIVYDDYDPEVIPYTAVIKSCLMIFDILMIEDLNTAVSGVYILCDLGRCPLKYVLQFSPTYVTKHVYCMETGYPLRLKGIQVENCPTALEVTIAIAKACLRGKIRDRLHVYSDNKDLQKVIPLELMPIEYGGKNGSVRELGPIWKSKVESYSNWFRDCAKYKTNEDLRPGKPRTTCSELGIEGSFRKLVVD
ncbi:retinol-binding protein pinta-like [Photinus pyralis]|uniref:retinol-binding protein pinta-like n=1 Tax=Photinus pyralis TaxID=7054 RepID=UPI001266F7FD|nr:retinol-binding protein pinta-like [Photinus pyralis]